jgi:hypothetical protein
MKRLLVIVVLVVGGVLAYRHYLGAQAAAAASPEATAEAYMKAAISNDGGKIRSLCADGAADAALEAAARLRGILSAVPSGIAFQTMPANPPAQVALATMAAERKIGFELARSGNGWKILKVEVPE